MHGGISPEFVNACTGKAGRFGGCLDRKVGSTTVWADPHTGNGFIESERGSEYHQFGMDKAKAPLQSNELKGIFPGHEQVEDGSRVQSSDDGYFVMTVFSAADYIGVFCRGLWSGPPWLYSTRGQGNKGAFVLATSTDGSAVSEEMSGRETRALAANFTGAIIPPESLGKWITDP